MRWKSLSVSHYQLALLITKSGQEFNRKNAEKTAETLGKETKLGGFQKRWLWYDRQKLGMFHTSPRMPLSDHNLVHLHIISLDLKKRSLWDVDMLQPYFVQSYVSIISLQISFLYNIIFRIGWVKSLQTRWIATAKILSFFRLPNSPVEGTKIWFCQKTQLPQNKSFDEFSNLRITKFVPAILGDLFPQPRDQPRRPNAGA